MLKVGDTGFILPAGDKTRLLTELMRACSSEPEVRVHWYALADLLEEAGQLHPAAFFRSWAGHHMADSATILHRAYLFHRDDSDSLYNWYLARLKPCGKLVATGTGESIMFQLSASNYSLITLLVDQGVNITFKGELTHFIAIAPRLRFWPVIVRLTRIGFDPPALIRKGTDLPSDAGTFIPSEVFDFLSASKNVIVYPIPDEARAALESTLRGPYLASLPYGDF